MNFHRGDTPLQVRIQFASHDVRLGAFQVLHSALEQHKLNPSLELDFVTGQALLEFSSTAFQGEPLRAFKQSMLDTLSGEKRTTPAQDMARRSSVRDSYRVDVDAQAMSIRARGIPREWDR